MLRCPRCAKPFDEDAEEASGVGEAEGDVAVCDVCGTELVAEGSPPVARPGYTELVKVYDARGEADLTVVRAILEGADVPVFAFGEHVRLTRPNAHALKALLVPLEFAARAAAVLREQGVLRPVAADRDELARLWAGEVVPLLAGAPAAALAADLGLRPEPFRAALLGALEAAGPHGTALLEDLALALALRGPREAARDAAGYLAASEGFRERRAGFIATLGAIVARGADADVAQRVVAALERFRGSIEAERALVPLLEHEDAGVRDATIEALFSVSGGETLGYEPDAEPIARKAAVARWWERVGGRAP